MEKTSIEALRKAIIESNGKIEFEEFSLDCEGEKKDIDIHFNGKLIAWFNTDNNITVSDDIKKAFEALKMEKENEGKKSKAQEILDEAEKKIKEAATAIGKVEAYEKLLLGRDLTISK